MGYFYRVLSTKAPRVKPFPPAFPGANAHTRPWGWAFIAAAFLAPFFFLTYGFATQYTAGLASVPTITFAWERHIPFWPWTIVPYWSIDLLYGLALWLCTTRAELVALVWRLVTVQSLSVGCFLLFPLRFSFERPATDGFFGYLFDVLMGFDKPFNQAPSLHIGLLVILWIVFARHSRGGLLYLVHAWFFLIGVSVLTTYQHHFLDVPTGALAGAFAAWLWPHPETAPWRLQCKGHPIGYFWLAAAGLCALPSGWGGAWLWCLWPALSFGLVAFHYLFGGAHGFQKTGPYPTAASLLLHGPYMAVAWLNSRLWTLRKPADNCILDGLWLGRHPTARHLRRQGYTRYFDVAAELPAPCAQGWAGMPLLDLIPPTPQQLEAAADALERARTEKTLVCCALGYGRSAMVVAAWLLRTGRCREAQAAKALILAARPESRLCLTTLQQVRPA